MGNTKNSAVIKSVLHERMPTVPPFHKPKMLMKNNKTTS